MEMEQYLIDQDLIYFLEVTMPAIKQAVKVLNEALDADIIAINNLIFNKVICGTTLAEHPTIQVQGYT
jgi:hypothetical protein